MCSVNPQQQVPFNVLQCEGVILAVNDRVGVPRPIQWAQRDTFRGQVIDGFGGDAEANNVDWTGKKVGIIIK